MGGRSSAYISYENPSGSSGVDLGIMSDISDSIDDDKDTKLPHSGWTQKLKDKNIHIKESTDKISEQILVPNAMKIHELSQKYGKSTKELKEQKQELRVRSHTMEGSVEAMFSSSPTNFENLQIVYNSDIRYMTKERLETQTQNQIASNFWTHSDKDELVNHTISHEYGHFIQRVLMERDIRSNKQDKERREKLLDDLGKTSKSKSKSYKIIQEYAEEYATKYIKAVQRVCRKNFGRDYEQKPLSDYSRESNREYFAEIFCNSETNKNPDDIGKAMKIYLNKKLN